MNYRTIKNLLLAFGIALIATGCKTTEQLYYHGDYNSAVYSYFKADQVSIAEQISMLEELLQQAAASSKPIAPGIHAHLGMLYFETGNVSLGKQHFEKEKHLFPESTKYIDFLLKSAKEA